MRPRGLRRVAALTAVLVAAALSVATPIGYAADAFSRAAMTDQEAEQKLLDLVGFLRRDGLFDDARKLAERGLAIAEERHGPNDVHVARWLTQLGLTLKAEDRFAQAEPHLKRAVAIYEKARGPDAAETGDAVGDLGSLYMDEGRLGEAEPLLKRALAVAEKTRGPEHAQTARSLTNLGTLYAEHGRASEAEPLLKRALAIDEKVNGPDHPDTAASLNNLAELYRETGRFADAEPLYKRALAIDEKNHGPDHPVVATSLGNLALLYQNQGRYAEAEPLYRRALDICEKKLGDHRLTASTIANYASMLIEQGRLSEAEPLMKRALAIDEKTLGPDHPDTGLSLNALAALYRTQERRAEAGPLYARALAIFEKKLGPNHPYTAMALNNLGEIYRDDGRLAEAEAMFKRSLATSEKILPPDHPNLIATRANLAGVFLFARRYTEAEVLFKATLGSLERTMPADHVQIGMANAWLARVLLEQRKYEEAVPVGRRAVQNAAANKSRAVARVLGGGWRDELDRDQIFALHARSLYALAMQKPQSEAALRAEGFEVIQRVGFDDTGRALANMASRLAAGSDNLARLLREQQDLLRRLQAIDQNLAAALGADNPAMRARADALRGESTAISARLKDIDATLRRNHKAYGDLADPNPIGIAETQSLLKADEAVVLYLPVEEAMFLIGVSKSDIVWTVAAVRSEELTKNIAALRRQLDPNLWQTRPLEPFDRALAHRLYRSMWAPLESVVKGKVQVFVVPTGPLTSFPLSVLVAEEPRGGVAGDADPQTLSDTAWLIKRHALTTLPSISSLKALRVYANKGSGSEPFAGFGDPAFGAPANMLIASRSVASVFRGASPDLATLRTLPPLPQTAGELKALAKALGASDDAVYLRERATEGQVKSIDLSKKRVIAFATHGLMAGDMGLGEPGLVFTPPGMASERDDGYLSASEAAGLNLKADWIILSACNTAAGDTPGAKGLSGLARAFFLAGSKSLLVSHWPVWDNAAMKLTTGTVTNMQKRPADGRAEALRQSMLTLMNDKSAPYFAHPAAWAPFILVGETRAN